MSSKAKEILSTSLYVLFILALSFIIIKFVGQRTEVIGDSMNPTLYDGDNLIMDKISYRVHEPERFDVVVFPPRNNPEKKNYIKRIIGLPGETVRIDYEGNIYINDEILKEDYGLQVIDEPGIANEDIYLGLNEYFVLGDNRNNSIDSRSSSVGKVTKDEIIGKAWVRIWPLNEIGFIKHRR
ncbi:MAG: signal peptidase I [Lachnospiraceae bacterium]|nr:signal peptidase I [Lachnospiraceae bacterium]